MRNKIIISEKTLRQFARMEVNLTQLLFQSMGKECEIFCNEYYRMTLDDIKQVLIKISDSNMSALEFAAVWLFPAFNDLKHNLCLTDLQPGFPETLVMFRVRYLPMTDDEMLLWVFKHLYEDFDLSRILEQSANEYFRIDELLETIDYHEFNSCMLPDQQTYTDIIKLDYIHEWDNDLLLREAEEGTRETFENFVVSLCKVDHPDALRILGYASLDGTSIFPCNYELAAECMEKLWRDFSFGYAANTLGHMHMQGLLSGGKPNYRKAFNYFSIGNTFGIEESSCYLAEMFMYGHYVSKNLNMAENLLTELYSKALIHFENGERETHLADVAVRMGELYLNLVPNPGLLCTERAHRYFLQADHANRIENKVNGLIANTSLNDRIKANLNKTSAFIPAYKSSHKVKYPDCLDEFVFGRGYCDYTLQLTPLKNDRYKFVIFRNRRGAEPNAEMNLVVYSDFGCCDLTDNINFVAENIRNINELNKIKSDIVFDTIETRSMRNSQDDYIVFIHNGEDVFKVQAGNYVIRRPNSKQ